MDIKELAKKIKYLEISTNRRVNEIFAGNYKSSFRGQGLEVSDLRPYEEGDDARHIDWITTARQGDPFVKKFQETRELTTMLLIDVSDSMKFTTSLKTKGQVAIETAAFILFSALKNNDKFGVVIFADQVYTSLPPRKGRGHLLRILREIIQAFDAYQWKTANQALALSFLNKTVKHSSICFLLSDSLGELAQQNNARNITPLKIANKKFDFVYLNIFDNFEKRIDDNYPAIKMINPETGTSEVINLKNKKIVANYNKIRLKRSENEKEVLQKNRIDSLAISTRSNIYKELLLFFRERLLKY